MSASSFAGFVARATRSASPPLCPELTLRLGADLDAVWRRQRAAGGAGSALAAVLVRRVGRRAGPRALCPGPPGAHRRAHGTRHRVRLGDLRHRRGQGGRAPRRSVRRRSVRARGDRRQRRAQRGCHRAGARGPGRCRLALGHRARGRSLVRALLRAAHLGMAVDAGTRRDARAAGRLRARALPAAARHRAPALRGPEPGIVRGVGDHGHRRLETALTSRRPRSGRTLRRDPLALHTCRPGRAYLQAPARGFAAAGAE